MMARDITIVKGIIISKQTNICGINNIQSEYQKVYSWLYSEIWIKVFSIIAELLIRIARVAF